MATRLLQTGELTPQQVPLYFKTSNHFNKLGLASCLQLHGGMKNVWTHMIVGFVAGWLLVGCSASTGSSESGGQEKQTPGGTQGLLTRDWQETPIPFFVSRTVPSDLVQPILDSFVMWEEQAGKKLFDYQGLADSTQHDFDGQNIVYWETTRHSKGYLGETYFMTVGKTDMVEADIVFFGDPKNFASLGCQNSSTKCFSSVGKYDVTTTALHEIGHLLGFDHTTAEGAIMNPNFGLGSIVHEFDQSLVSELQGLYNPATVAVK